LTGAESLNKFFLEEIIFYKIDVYIKDKEGGTALTLAVKSGKVEVMNKVLRFYKIDVNIKGKEDSTAPLWRLS
jgi:hypothetical protein